MAKGNEEDQTADVLETMEQAGEVLNYDPFREDEPADEGPAPRGASGGEVQDEPREEPQAELEPPAPEPAPPAKPPKKAPAPAPAAAPAAAEPPPAAPTGPPPTPLPERQTPVEPTMADLLQVVMRQQEQLGQLTSRVAGPPAEPEEPEGPPVPDYMFEVPDQLLEMVRSEDPNVQKAGLAHMIGGMAQAIHRKMYGELQNSLTPVIDQRVNVVRSEADRRRAMHDDFYGTYKFLDNPRLKPMIATVATQVAAEWRTNEWSPQMRDEVYRRVVDDLRTVAAAAGSAPVELPPTVPASGAAPATPTPAVLGSPAPVAPAGGPPAILESGVRPGLRPSGSVADEVEELLF
jgi:hypothetical protein